MREQTKLIPHVSELQHTVAAMRNQGARLNAIDGRLALIEKHTGMVKA